MKLEKFVGFLIVLVIMIIIVIIAVTLRISNNEDEISDVNSSEGDEGEVISYEEQEVERLTDFIKFFTISNCVDQYVEKLNINNSSYYGYDENNEYTIVVSDEEINEYIYSFLSADFIEDNNIEISNIRDFVDVYEQKVIFTPLQMNVYIQETIEKYVVYGFLVDLNMNFIEDVYIGVNLDVTNNTFSIEPILDENVTDIDQIEIINENEEIEENEFNIYEDVQINYEYLCKEYLQTYKKLILAMPELAYEYLDDEYRETRFGSYEDFTEYITENYDNLYTLTLSEYDVETYDNYKEYICKDAKGNMYIFIETDEIMNFVAQLDDYTIETADFIEAYNSATDEEKVQTNIDKFFKMINTKDYVSAYKLLNDTFKENNFATIDEFKEYVQNNFFENTTITTVNELTESGTYYICTVTTTNTSDTSETMEETFIVSLGEDTDFEMSFTIKE